MSIKDNFSPKLISVVPEKGLAAIAVNQDVVLTFNEAVQLGTGNISISNGAGDTRTIPVSSSEISVIGQKITLNPAKDLQPNSHYTVKIDNTAIQDLSGNKYAGIKNATTLYFDTVDTLAPSLVKSNLLGSTSSVATNSNIVLTLSENIKMGSGNITIISGNDSRTFAITDPQVKISGTTLTINPTVDLNINSTYKVHLDAGAIKDLAPVSNSSTAIDLSFITQATGDKQAPVLQSYVGKGVVSDNLQLTFQENIKIGKGSFTLVNSADSTDKMLIDVSSPQVSIVNNVLTINPINNLKPESTYLLTAPKGILTDLAKNAFAGIVTKVPFKFDTHDTTAPELKISGEKATATNSPVTYTFTASEAIKGFTADAITVTGGTKAATLTTVSPTVYTLIVTPTDKSIAPITVNVAAGKFTDLVNNANLATATSTQEIDTVAPTITITDDKLGVANSPILYAFTLSEASNTFTLDDIAVTGGTKAATLNTVSPTVYTLSVTPNDNSIIPITVDVITGKFTDAAGNNNIAAVQSIQAVDTVLPFVTISDNQPNVATGGAILYTFTLSEPSSNFSIDDITMTGGTKAETLTTVSSTVYTLSVMPNDNSILPITVDVAASKFTDAAGNNNIAALQSIQQVKTTPTFGKAIDGYLAGSTVTVGTYTTTTDASGNFTLPAGLKGEVVVSGGTDLTTGKAFKGVLKAPEGSSAVTPLTTVQQGFIASGQTPAEAQASVAKAFGFANNVDLATYDPIATLTNASPADKAQATALMANAAKIANFLVTAGETLKGAGGDKVTASSAGDAILKSLVNSVNSVGSTGVIDLGNANLLTTVFTDSAKEVAKTVTGTTDNFAAKITAMAATVASVIKDATDNIAAVVATGGSSDTLLTSMGNVSKFTQEGASAKLQDIAKTLDPANATAILASAVSTLTGDAADKSISKGSSTPDSVVPSTSNSSSSGSGGGSLPTPPTAVASIVSLSTDTGSNSSDFITKTAAQTISGTYTATLANGETLKVSLDNGTTWVAATTATGGNWTLTGTTITSNTIKAAVFNTAGNSSTTASQVVVLDTSAPTNQNAVLSATAYKNVSGAAVTIVSSGDTTNDVWLAPAGTTTFTAGATMTKASGTATTILSPTTEGTYKLFVLDAAGNISTASTASVVVDRTAPTASVSGITTITNTDSISVQSTEVGTAYLVLSSLTQPSNLATLLTLKTANPTSIKDVSVLANTGTSLSATELVSGSYNIYTADTAGNLSSALANAVTIKSNQNLDALTPSTISSPYTFNAGTGLFVFTDNATAQNFTKITNFGADDEISFTNLGSNHLTVSSQGYDVQLTVNANGTVSEITLVGVNPTSSVIASIDAFNALSAVGDVTYS